LQQKKVVRRGNFEQVLNGNSPVPAGFNLIRVSSWSVVMFVVPVCKCAQESNGRGCPFCRCEIKGTEPIVIDVFQPMPQQPASKTAALHVFDHSRHDASEVSVVSR